MRTQHDLFAKPLSHIDRNLLSILCCFLIITAMWLGVCLNNSSTALAKPAERRIAEVLDGAIASQPTIMNDLKNQVKDDLKGSGSAIVDHNFVNPTAGKARPVVRQTERSFAESARQAGNAEDAVDKRTEKGVAQPSRKAVGSGHKVENVIEDITTNLKIKVN